MENSQKQNPKQSFYLTSEAILKYFLNTSDQIDTLIMCQSTEVNIATTDQNLYEALGSLTEYDNYKPNKLVKFLESVTIDHAPKKILTHQRVEELRKIALGN